ncbi:MAG: flagellin lysine-N-methylase [Clostridia bacterium]|nr:flagellin lysine-N-methylase [Clostridia bacterium]
MKLYAPTYYKKFACIADRCRHTCCAGWEIDIDPDTLRSYARLTDGYGKVIASSIDPEGTPHFRLCEGERCPHLDAGGLCCIIKTLGEEYLCDICREHPRFYHDTAKGKEVGLGMACEEACRLILSHAHYWEFEEVGETNGKAQKPKFDALPHRERLYALLSDTTVPYTERLRRIAATYGVTPADRADDIWRALLASLEYMDETHRVPFASCYRSAIRPGGDLEALLERSLAYFIFRHCSDAYDPDDLRASLGFCLVCERLLASLATAGNVRDTQGMIELARMLSEELEYSEENTAAIKEAFGA